MSRKLRDLIVISNTKETEEFKFKAKYEPDQVGIVPAEVHTSNKKSIIRGIFLFLNPKIHSLGFNVNRRGAFFVPDPTGQVLYPVSEIGEIELITSKIERGPMDNLIGAGTVGLEMVAEAIKAGNRIEIHETEFDEFPSDENKIGTKYAKERRPRFYQRREKGIGKSMQYNPDEITLQVGVDLNNLVAHGKQEEFRQNRIVENLPKFTSKNKRR